MMGFEEEGFGVVFLEAAACGLPVVAGDSGGSPEAIADGETGLLVDGQEVQAIVTALDRLLSDPELAATMGKAGRAFVEREFHPDRIIARLQEDMDGIVAGRLPLTEF
jgi:phosphatidylinositol alpha-1,6-mannosyltransferase